jgi:phosphoglycolate phosphatase-like HAD superfamily hydrolase
MDAEPIRGGAVAKPWPDSHDSPPDIRAVLFDVDGTLYRQWPLRTAMAFELALHQLRISGSGSGLTTLRVLKVYRRAHEDLRGQVGSDTLSALQIGLAAARANVEPEAVRTIVNRWMVERPLKYLRWVRRPGLLQLLEDLAQRGIRVGALSDYACDAKLKALGVARFFSLALCTAEPCPSTPSSPTRAGSFTPASGGTSIPAACSTSAIVPTWTRLAPRRLDCAASSSLTRGAPPLAKEFP